MTGPGLMTFPLILSAPSGAGKTTIAHQLASLRSDVVFSVSATTRAPRKNEADGVDYHFRSETDFDALIARDELLEWAEVHGHRYGTLRSSLDVARGIGQFLLLDIDVQGARQVKQAVPDAVSVFVLPPSGSVLARRLVGRGSETTSRQLRRLAGARRELLAANEFDYIVVNDELGQAVEAVDGILKAESRRVVRAKDVAAYTARLIHELDAVLEHDGPP